MTPAPHDHHPEIGPGAFVHPGAHVMGQVRLGAGASVWPAAVIRGDSDLICIGERSNIQDGAVIHADEGVPCTIGAGVSVGHLACVHGADVGDDCLVGIGAIILNGARIGAGSIIGAGALVPEGRVIPAGSLVLGVPGRVARPVSEEQRADLERTAAHYVELAQAYRGE